MILKVSDEFGSDDVGGAGQSAVVEKEAAAEDRSDHAVKKEGLSGQPHLAEHLGNIDRIPGRDRGAIFPEPQMHTSALGKDCPVEFGAIKGSARCATIEAIEETERNQELSVDSWRGD